MTSTEEEVVINETYSPGFFKKFFFNWPGDCLFVLSNQLSRLKIRFNTDSFCQCLIHYAISFCKFCKTGNLIGSGV